MRELLIANLRAHLFLARRSRLILALAITLGALFLFSVIGTVFVMVATDRGLFDQLRGVYQMAAGFLFVFASVTGLVLLAAPVRDRSLKMVLTRPCSLEIWLASVFTAGVVITLAAYAALGVATALLSLLMGIPLQNGIVFLPLSDALGAITAMSFLCLLGCAVHPVLALGLALVLQHSFWGEIAELADRGSGRLLAGLAYCLRAIDLLLPRWTTVPESVAAVGQSFRAEAGQWWGLLGHLGYTALFLTFSYLLAVVFLRRRSFA